MLDGDLPPVVFRFEYSGGGRRQTVQDLDGCIAVRVDGRDRLCRAV